MWKGLTFKLEGVTELTQHNVRLSDPLDPIVIQIKLIAKKKNKTEEDYRKLSDLEFEGSLYLNKDGKPWEPSSAFHRAMVEAARRQKRGKHVEGGVMVKGSGFDLEYKGPKTLKGLLADESFRLVRMMTVMGKKVRRTRAVFHEWACTVPMLFEDTVFDQAEVVEFMEQAGLGIGVGDTRQRAGGRFDVVSFDAA